MSTHAGHSHDALAQDPTRTRTLRSTYSQRLRGGYSRINTVVREYVGRRDIFGVGRDALVTPPSNFSFTTDDRKIEGFEAWLQQAQDDEVLEVIGRNNNQFIRQAYHKGLENATRDLRDAGIDVDSSNIDDVFNLGVHQQELQTLYTRNLRELEGITRAVDQQVSRELADGFAQGRNPNDIARSITDRVDKIGKTRATTMARTEVINAHATSQLNRYERMGVDEVTGKAELLTAGDSRVCAQCASLEGNTYPLDEARGIIPVHPSCRCRWLPVVNN